jgi:surfeit locus 1 family protein
MRVLSRLLFVASLVVALIFARLGVWQVSRLHQRQALNARALAERTEPPVTIENANSGDSLAGRRVVAVGRYDDDHTVVLRSRAYQGVPGVEVVSPLVLEGGRGAVLVNRGFLPSPDAFTAHPDSVRESGRVRVSGIALPIGAGGGAPLRRGAETTWARLDREMLQARLPYPIGPFYIQQLPDSGLPRFPRRLDAPALDDGPHLSYAIQWFSFSAMALVFGIILTIRSSPSRSRW